MKTIPDKCKDENIASSFCECIADVESVDVAAKGFCARVKSGSETKSAGEDLAELKKALMDLETRP